MKARVYKNLNNGKWSIKQRVDGKWTVVGHCDACTLLSAVPYISAKRHAAVQDGHREVFAWLEGDLSMVEGFVPFRDRSLESHAIAVQGLHTPITFKAKGDDMRGFHYVATGLPFTGGDARFTTDAVYTA